MIRSLNEIQGLVLKAARGAGAPLGIAEDLSESVPFALASNALETIADILSAGNLTPLLADIAAIDAGLCGHDAPPLPATGASLYAALAASRGLTALPQAITNAHPVKDRLWARLQKLAARTYVPASQASRATGAGAGLTDND